MKPRIRPHETPAIPSGRPAPNIVVVPQVNAPQELSMMETATLLGIHRDTLKRWIRDGKVPDVSRRPNHYRVFTQADIEAIRRYMQGRAPSPKTGKE